MGEAVGVALLDAFGVGVGATAGLAPREVKVWVGVRLCQVLPTSYATKYVYVPAGKVRLSGVNVVRDVLSVVGMAPLKS